MALTVTKVARLREPGRYGDGNGLYLQVLSPTNRSWIFRYERSGRERLMGLGPLHTITLDEAREAARQARKLLLEGTDPLEARKAQHAARALEEAKSLTFEAAAKQYFDLHESKWRNAKHRQQFLNTLRDYAFPKIGRLAVADIDTGQVLRVIEPIWHEKTETADRTRARIEAVLEWATVRGYRVGENPAKWKGHLQAALPARSQIKKVKHHAALPWVQLPAFMIELRQKEGVAARALEFAILTAARTGEVIGATWPEIDLPGKLWTIPAARMKAKRPHRVPLSDQVVSLLQDLPREADFLFPGGRKGAPISNMAMAILLKRMERDDITVHGFRSTFRDWTAERTSYPQHVAEMALAHVIGDKVEAAYRRGDLLDQRRRLMRDWAAFCSTAGGAGANVLPIGQGVARG
jgi:integrase